MKKILFAVLLSLLIAGVVVAKESASEVNHQGQDLGFVTAVDSSLDSDPMAKKCSFNSDCRYGNCKSGSCGACSFNSDCKGWGNCKSGMCGSCSFNSDCKGFGDCKSGRCSKSPY